MAFLSHLREKGIYTVSRGQGFKETDGECYSGEGWMVQGEVKSYATRETPVEVTAL